MRYPIIFLDNTLLKIEVLTYLRGLEVAELEESDMPIL